MKRMLINATQPEELRVALVDGRVPAAVMLSRGASPPRVFAISYRIEHGDGEPRWYVHLGPRMTDGPDRIVAAWAYDRDTGRLLELDGKVTVPGPKARIPAPYRAGYE